MTRDYGAFGTAATRSAVMTVPSAPTAACICDDHAGQMVTAIVAAAPRSATQNLLYCALNIFMA